MEKYQITFYDDNDKQIAVAIAQGKTQKEAEDKAFKFLSKKYPTIRPGVCMVRKGPFPQDVSNEPVEFSDELGSEQPS